MGPCDSLGAPPCMGMGCVTTRRYLQAFAVGDIECQGGCAMAIFTLSTL